MNNEFINQLKYIEAELRALKTVQGPIRSTVAFSYEYTGAGTSLNVEFAEGDSPIICTASSAVAGIPLQIANNSQRWQFNGRSNQPIIFSASRPIHAVSEV